MEEGTAIGQQLPFLDQRSKGRGRPSRTNLMMTGFIRTRITTLSTDKTLLIVVVLRL